MKKKIQYDDYIRRSILLNNEFGIIEMSPLEELKSMTLIREQYKEIANLARSKDVESIKNLKPSSSDNTSEYISIMQFNDQDDNLYIVTTYDSDLITQDPQVIDIFKM